MFKKINKLDELVLKNIIKLHSPAMNKVMAAITTLGNMGVIWFAFCLPLLLTHKWRSVGINIIIGLVITHIMGEGLIKHIVCRKRPCHRFEEDEQIIDKPKYYSFPSGHSAASFSVFAVVVIRCGPIFWVPVLIMASLIAFSRVYLRVHYLTDVIAGVLLGFICGTCSVFLFDHMFNKII